MPDTAASLVGCDFSSRPTRKKPVVIAYGTPINKGVQLQKLERLESLEAYADWLQNSQNWLGAFDFPFGLPRELLEHLGWPLQWLPCMRHFAKLSRDDIRATFANFCNERPTGGKFAHRATDRPAGSSPSMKWVNPPVAFMLHAGISPMIDAGIHLPGLHATQSRKIALEGYPGLLAREVLGARSYKSDDKTKQTPERLIARKDLITCLEHGQTRLGLRLKLSHSQRDALIDDPSGDSLDAVLCLVQAAWSDLQGAPLYGLPKNLDPIEGWILTA